MCPQQAAGASIEGFSRNGSGERDVMRNTGKGGMEKRRLKNQRNQGRIGGGDGMPQLLGQPPTGSIGSGFGERPATGRENNSFGPKCSLGMLDQKLPSCPGQILNEVVRQKSNAQFLASPEEPIEHGSGFVAYGKQFTSGFSP